jgi:hypothetical protein
MTRIASLKVPHHKQEQRNSCTPACAGLPRSVLSSSQHVSRRRQPKNLPACSAHPCGPAERRGSLAFAGVITRVTDGDREVREKDQAAAEALKRPVVRQKQRAEKVQFVCLGERHA